MSRQLVSAVVVNWNGARDLERGLPSLTTQSYQPLEILIMDNGSTDESEKVVSKFPAARWVPLGRNLGLAAALNRGAQMAQGEIVLLLNNDMRFHADFVARLTEEILKSDDIFAVDGLQYDWEGTQTVHSATFLASEVSGPLGIGILPGLALRQEVSDGPIDVVMASAANMMVRRRMFLELGGMDERFPIGYEDVDLCWRAHLRGWRTIFVPSAVCWHDVSKSSRSSAGARFRFRGTMGGKLLFVTKLLPMKYVFKAWGLALLGACKDLVKADVTRLNDRVTTLAKLGSYLPSVIGERRQMYRQTGNTPQGTLDSLMQIGRS